MGPLLCLTENNESQTCAPASCPGPPLAHMTYRLSFETDIHNISIELRFCQTIKNSMLDNSLKRLLKMNSQIFCWESKREPNFMIFWRWAKLVTRGTQVKIPAGSITYRVNPLLCKLFVYHCESPLGSKTLAWRVKRLKNKKIHDFGFWPAGLGWARLAQPAAQAHPWLT